MSAQPIMFASTTGPSIIVLPDAETLTLAAATTIVAQARQALKRNRRFTIALSGGGTPRPIYEALARQPFARLVPWAATHVFWGDERCVEPGDKRSNERMARKLLLHHVPIPEDQIHPMRCTGYEEPTARRAADEYEALLRGFFRTERGIDLMLLGMGDNGHTASLFPGSDVLREQKRWAAAAYEDPATAAATSGTAERLWRVTMTAPFINRSGLTVFVVSGASKAPVVRNAIQGEADPQALPARLVRPANGRLLWLLDEAAAAELRPAPGSAAGTATSGSAESKAAAPEYTVRPESFDDLDGCELGPSR